MWGSGGSISIAKTVENVVAKGRLRNNGVWRGENPAVLFFEMATGGVLMSAFSKAPPSTSKTHSPSH
jgi:hypothetical protein